MKDVCVMYACEMFLGDMKVCDRHTYLRKVLFVKGCVVLLPMPVCRKVSL